MKPTVHIRGMKDVMQNLDKVLKQTNDNCLKALIRCSMLVRQGTEKESPKTPVDFGNLRASWFAVTAKDTVGKQASFKGEGSGSMQTEHQSTVSSAQQVLRMGKKPSLIMGYTANYALYVHEMINADFTTPRKRGGKLIARRKGAGAKWFEASILRNEKQMVKIIQDEINLK